jgi:hypothetical protein
MSRSDEMTLTGKITSAAARKRLLDMARHRDGSAGVFFSVPEEHVARDVRK